MLPTRLTVWLFLFGLAPLLAGVTYAILLAPDPDSSATVSTVLNLLVFAYAAGILLVFVVEGLLARRAFTKLRAPRERPARLSVGIDNGVVLLLETRGGRALRVLARDEPPPG